MLTHRPTVIYPQMLLLSYLMSLISGTLPVPDSVRSVLNAAGTRQDFESIISRYSNVTHVEVCCYQSE